MEYGLKLNNATGTFEEETNKHVIENFDGLHLQYIKNKSSNSLYN